ncbi:phosphodiester glycosidase family protein [Paenibacillus sp. TC-CSREp1]|uniref:phosphodiester glycosidase family protein n=1 Tax=Paenibacillus sp. TC-CSREp1 TaxID=3410089 RepID=UPI003CF0B789
MTVAQSISYTHNGNPVRTIKADLAAISVVDVGAKSVKDSPYFGVNGTFFDGPTMLGIAMQNGSAVRSGSNRTGQACGVSTKRGTMFCYNGGTSVATGVVDYASEAKLNNVKWAIGGYSLFPNVSYANADAFYTAIHGKDSSSDCTKAKAGSQNAFRFAPTSKTQRTAIGWDGSKIWLAVFELENAWGVRQFMINRGCNLAIMLDGGGSSQMNYAVVRNGNPVSTNYDPRGVNRPIYTMVRVSATDWI